MKNKKQKINKIETKENIFIVNGGKWLTFLFFSSSSFSYKNYNSKTCFQKHH